MAVELLGAADIRRLAKSLEVSPTKKWGQNFVIDPNTVRRIVDEANIVPDDVVLEVGPGLGSLTLGLLDVCSHVIAIEIDQRLAQQLPHTIAKFAPTEVTKLSVVASDALLIEDLDQQPTKLVANLPYNVSVPVILHLLEQFPSISEVLVMVQSEVGDRLAAQPGSKIYGIPSLKAAWYAHVSKAASISRQIFWPVPNVDSVLIRLVRHESYAETIDRDLVFGIIDAAFGQRRKTLRAALSTRFGNSAKTAEILEKAGVDPSLRAEQLDLNSFIAIAKASLQVG